jgi:hypothetical protein
MSESSKNKNQAARDPQKGQQKLPDAGAPARQQSAQQRRVQIRADLEERSEFPFFPVVSLQENLTSNKALSTKRLIFRQTLMGPYGMRKYEYEIEDQGAVVHSYVPLGSWQS